MTTALQRLHTDHINTARLLNILQQQLLRLAEDGEPDFSLMINVMIYLTQYPDLYHHPQEDLIFEQWQKIDPDATPLVEEMTVEHKSIIRSGIHLLELLRGLPVATLQSRDEVIDTGHRYLTLLREHMNKEESQLFPRIENTLRSEDWKRLDAQICAPDDPLFGRAVSDRFRARYAQIMRLIEEQ